MTGQARRGRSLAAVQRATARPQASTRADTHAIALDPDQLNAPHFAPLSTRLEEAAMTTIAHTPQSGRAG